LEKRVSRLFPSACGRLGIALCGNFLYLPAVTQILQHISKSYQPPPFYSFCHSNLATCDRLNPVLSANFKLLIVQLLNSLKKYF
ncbi:MAG: hypothetical protein NC131_11735, partial [Roseburia sp.]|nr:hypothetical protein [Roseburia sp.]